MIVFDLICSGHHQFEGWFASSAEFDRQQRRHLVACPVCQVTEIIKAPMAPAVPAKGRSSDERSLASVATGAPHAEMQAAAATLAKAQAALLKGSTWVGTQFAETSRKMHYGETEHRQIHGHATLAEARALVDEGVPVAPLPLAVAPPEKLN